MTEEKRTPGPWAQSHRNNKRGMSATEIYDTSGETIATLAWYPVEKGNGVTATAREANAAFICLAVNNHDALVEALKPLAAFAEHLPMSGKPYEESIIFAFNKTEMTVADVRRASELLSRLEATR